MRQAVQEAKLQGVSPFCLTIDRQSADYLLKVIVKDMDAYQQFLLQKLTRIEGVSGVHSSFVLKSPIDKTALPV